MEDTLDKRPIPEDNTMPEKYDYWARTVAELKQMQRSIGHLSFPPTKVDMVPILEAWDESNKPLIAAYLPPRPKMNRGKRTRAKPKRAPAAGVQTQTLKRKEQSPAPERKLRAKRQKTAGRAGRNSDDDNLKNEPRDTRAVQDKDEETIDHADNEIRSSPKAIPKTRKYKLPVVDEDVERDTTPKQQIEQILAKASGLLPQDSASVDEDNQNKAQSTQSKSVEIRRRPVRKATRKPCAANRNTSNNQSIRRSNKKELTSSSASQQSTPSIPSSQRFDDEDHGGLYELDDEHPPVELGSNNEAPVKNPNGAKKAKKAKKTKTPQEIEADIESEKREKEEEERELHKLRPPSRYVDEGLRRTWPVRYRIVKLPHDHDIPSGTKRAPMEQISSQRWEERYLEQAKEQGVEVKLWMRGQWPPENTWLEPEDYVYYD
jgi:hypothetical protein